VIRIRLAWAKGVDHVVDAHRWPEKHPDSARMPTVREDHVHKTDNDQRNFENRNNRVGHNLPRTVHQSVGPSPRLNAVLQASYCDLSSHNPKEEYSEQAQAH
jgi:hypothetical protein